MMKQMRLINAEEIKYTEQDEPCGNGMYNTVRVAYECDIDATPTIEAIPVKWIDEWLGYRSEWERHGVKSLLRDWGKEQRREE